MKLELLHEFVVLTKHQNITNAARELYQSQPNLSMHISALEKELGYALFERSTSGVTLTPAGAAFLVYAQRILDTYDEALEVCAGIVRAEPLLRISSVLPHTRPYEALMRLKERHPFAFVDLALEMPLIKALQKGIVDCGTCYDYPSLFGTLDESRFEGLAFTMLGKSKLSICLMRSHPLARSSRFPNLSRADLKGETVVCFSGSHFDDWQRLILRVLGEETRLNFCMSPTQSLSNLSLVDLGQMLYVCGSETVLQHFAHRDDVVILDHLDGEELLFNQSFAYFADNPLAATLAQALAAELSGFAA